MRKVLLLLVAFVLIGSVAKAHHSYGATYDTKKEIKLEGKLAQFVYRNPHSFVHMMAKDENGEMQRWAVEWSGTAQLANSGVQRDSLKVGDDIVVTGRLGSGMNPEVVYARPLPLIVTERSTNVQVAAGQ